MCVIKAVLLPEQGLYWRVELPHCLGCLGNCWLRILYPWAWNVCFADILV